MKFVKSLLLGCAAGLEICSLYGLGFYFLGTCGSFVTGLPKTGAVL